MEPSSFFHLLLFVPPLPPPPLLPLLATPGRTQDQEAAKGHIFLIIFPPAFD